MEFSPFMLCMKVENEIISRKTGWILCTPNVSLSHTTLILIIIRIEMNYKDSKTLPHNTSVFVGLELKIFN